MFFLGANGSCSLAKVTSRPHESCPVTCVTYQVYFVSFDGALMILFDVQQCMRYRGDPQPDFHGDRAARREGTRCGLRNRQVAPVAQNGP